ncbi:MAG TPA: biotin/lipoyl-containing protein, partial [Kofleriaceae bacterium]|nr:biotin/lipoyl-containing protein [Kofleriaceae bacterium]
AGLAVRAPSSGRYWGRPAPGKPPFVSVGDELQPGQTVCLLEVMKTFHRVTYGGDGLPARGRVATIAPADGDDLAAGDVIIEVVEA